MQKIIEIEQCGIEEGHIRAHNIISAIPVPGGILRRHHYQLTAGHQRLATHSKCKGGRSMIPVMPV
eukprot:scaffold40492_cov56-Attheya_sp.AAC.1